MRKNWQCQQQQHSTSGTDVPSFWEQRQKSEDLLEVQDDSKHIPEVDQAPGNWEQSISTKDEIHTVDVDVTTSTFPSEDANNQIIERIEVGSKKICIREDPVKESMEFSQESTQAVQDSGNVELIELRPSEIQCPSCGHAVFKETIICTYGKLFRPNQEMIQRVKAAFHILKPLYFRTSSVTSKGCNHGHQL